MVLSNPTKNCTDIPITTLSGYLRGLYVGCNYTHNGLLSTYPEPPSNLGEAHDSVTFPCRPLPPHTPETLSGSPHHLNQPWQRRRADVSEALSMHGTGRCAADHVRATSSELLSVGRLHFTQMIATPRFRLHIAHFMKAMLTKSSAGRRLRHGVFRVHHISGNIASTEWRLSLRPFR